MLVFKFTSKHNGVTTAQLTIHNHQKALENLSAPSIHLMSFTKRLAPYTHGTTMHCSKPTMSSGNPPTMLSIKLSTYRPPFIDYCKFQIQFASIYLQKNHICMRLLVRPLLVRVRNKRYTRSHEI